MTQPEKQPQVVTYRGKPFEVEHASWTQIEPGCDHYQANLAYTCCDIDIVVAYFEPDSGQTEEETRGAALAHACAELYEIVLNHESRCAKCQADIVAGLLRPRRRRIEPTGDPETEEEP